MLGIAREPGVEAAPALATFEELLLSSSTQAFQLAHMMLADAQEAEDAVQESAVKAWTRFGRFRPGRVVPDLVPGHRGQPVRSMRRTRRWQLRRDGLELLDVPLPGHESGTVRRLDVRSLVARQPAPVQPGPVRGRRAGGDPDRPSRRRGRPGDIQRADLRPAPPGRRLPGVVQPPERPRAARLRRAGHDVDGDPRLHAGADQPVPGVGDRRHPAVGDDRHVIAGSKPLDQAGNARVLVRIEERDGGVAAFSGDDQLVVVSEGANGAAAVVEWRTGREVWKRPASWVLPGDARSLPLAPAMAMTVRRPGAAPDVFLVRSDGTSAQVAQSAVLLTLGSRGGPG